MNIPHCLYEQYRDRLLLKVINLTSLSVPQIQALERFASERRGWFDFNTHTIHLEKRLDIEHLEKLFASSGIMVTLEEKERQEVPPKCDMQAKIGFGKYKGHAYAEIPDDYLKWLKSNYYGPEREVLENEIRRRAL